ncbi:alpha/beta hydrolase [Dasania sp. GY-MA-18]|uniref:Alpha/beta hydrolase n=1 Tax=Dasania phycosphaerae TaxID=2950436 RepID=A0A9J6RG35_9GAMM|nr:MULTISPECIES: alpha/beta hydrolase [Dasania]MCR8921186.1 alpha/beta hydrolase [Dasania sp. GY-MA-18]MCZ0863614.1 alpha/beta hydrolase [Dasania phycosphaerae]MCZ0867342.1 alpha/beta hydrolase [Dasania phycosphaerae]
MPFIQARDISLYYEIQGHGPKLLYINGSGADLRNKPNIFDSSLAQHFTILAFDQRGLGQSGKPDYPYTLQDYADDTAALLAAVGWDSCLVMGVSFGGMVAQHFALNYPQHVQRLVLACTSSGGEGGDSFAMHTLDALPAYERAKRFLVLSDTRRDHAWQLSHAETFQRLINYQLAAKQIGVDEPNHAIGLQRQLQARIGHDTYAQLPQLQMPVFICGGRFDGIAPPANLEAMHSQIPHSHLQLFSGGHLFYLQDKRAFKRITQFFMGEYDQA